MRIHIRPGGQGGREVGTWEAELLTRLATEEVQSAPFDAVVRMLTERARLEVRLLRARVAADPDDLELLRVQHWLTQTIDRLQNNWRSVVARAAVQGVPVPAFSSALSYYDSYRSASLPANLLQAQRDYFGAHTYERVDAPRGKFFHLDWPEPGRPQLEA